MELTEIDTCRGLLGACQPLALPGLTLLWGQAVLRAPRTLYPILSHPQGHGRMALECSRGPPSLGPVSGLRQNPMKRIPTSGLSPDPGRNSQEGNMEDLGQKGEGWRES